MTITKFSARTVSEKLELLQAKGVYLSKRKWQNSTAILYQFNQLYVEILYKEYRKTIDDIHCSDNMDILDPYLNGIDIEGIFDKNIKPDQQQGF